MKKKLKRKLMKQRKYVIIAYIEFGEVEVNKRKAYFDFFFDF